MYNRSLIFLLSAVLLAISSAGCTHVQLRNSAVGQALTVTDVCQQQVLNNLAMFAYDYHSLPHFSFPNSSGANVTDQGNLAATPAWAPSSIASPAVLFNGGFNVGASRQNFESFVLTPVTAPRKLELMRCAYQKEMAACGHGTVSESCPDCETRFKVFYTGDEQGDIGKESRGRVTSECIGKNCWFRMGCRKCVPKDCPCLYVGNYCGVYVWVPPGGRDELAKLTLAILDYALHDPPIPVPKQVSYFIDELGLPTTAATAVGQVVATIDVKEHTESILDVDKEDEAKLRLQIIVLIKEVSDAINALEPRLTVGNDDGGEEGRLVRERLEQLYNQKGLLEAKQRYLDRQISLAGLKQEYIRPTQPGVSGGAGTQQLRQLLDLLAPTRGSL
jgi:hypothetical protein